MRRPARLLAALALAGLEIAAGTARAQGAAPGRATDADIEPPVIEIEALDEVAAAASQVFTAQVVDDRGLRDVRLYHRRAGKREFESVPMLPVGRSAFHSVTLDTDPADLRTIEYYVQARDGGGNRSVEGFAFEPLVRRLTPAVDSGLARVPVTKVPASARVSGPTARDAAPSSGSPVRWWHVALGVVAAGTLAALAGGGDDGASSDGAAISGPTVPLTINLGEPSR